MQHALRERQRRADGTGGVEHEGNPPGSEPEIQQTVVNVSPVGRENGFVAKETPENTEAHFKQRQGERHGRGRHAQHGCGFLAPNDAVGPQQESDQQAAAIAQKDRRRIEIVEKEGDQCADQRRCRQGQRNIPLQNRRYDRGQGGHHADSGGESVDPVDQVERIGAKHQPPDRQRQRKPADLRESGNIGDA